MISKAKRTTHEFREKERLRAKTKYDRLREEGICTRCGKGKPEVGKINCEDCLAVYRGSRRPGYGPYKRYPDGSFLQKLTAMSGLTVLQISTATGIPDIKIYEWRSRKPTREESILLKTYLIGE